MTCDTQEKEIEAVAKWLADRVKEGTAPHEIGLFVRSVLKYRKQEPPQKDQNYRIGFLMTPSKQPADKCLSARCTWPRDWNFAPFV